MKIQASGTIGSMLLNDNEKGLVDISFHVGGKISDAPSTAKEAWADVELNIKSLVAEQLRFGQKLYVTISTEPPEES